MKRLLLGVLLGLLAQACYAAGGPYDATADARQEIRAAITTAQSSHKLVLIDFGANWCPDCLSLDAAFHHGVLARVIRDGFVVVHVDVGNFDKNLDQDKAYGDPIDQGIPAVVVIQPDGKIVYSSKSGALSDARHMDEASLVTLFWSIRKPTR